MAALHPPSLFFWAFLSLWRIESPSYLLHDFERHMHGEDFQRLLMHTRYPQLGARLRGRTATERSKKGSGGRALRRVLSLVATIRVIGVNM